LLFIAIAVLVEYLVFLYALTLGVKEKPESLLQGSLQFPGTDWTITITISPLFHLVPVAVIITLVSIWIYLTKHIAVKPLEIQKGKSRFAPKLGKPPGKIRPESPRTKSASPARQEAQFARATMKSALPVILVFSGLVLMFSVLAYPNLVYQIISSAYKHNPSLFNFVRGTAQAFAPMGDALSAINNALLYISPGFRDAVLSVGIILSPLIDTDSVGKYLVLQNAAAWISALAAMFYGEYTRKGHRSRKTRRS